MSPLDMLDQMGTAAARRVIREQPRVDTPERQKRVDKAARLIHKKGYAINSHKVEALLKDESYTPTKVSLELATHMQGS